MALDGDGAPALDVGDAAEHGLGSAVAAALQAGSVAGGGGGADLLGGGCSKNRGAGEW